MNPQFEFILNLVAQEFGVPREEVFQKTRGVQAISWARHVAIYLCRVAEPEITLTDVGKLFGRDRSTIAYALARVEDQRDLPDFDDLLRQMEAQIKARFAPE